LSHAHRLPRTRGRVGLALVCGLIAALCLALVPGAADAKGKGKKVGHTLTVMTRNLYLGADLTPALTAPSLPAAINAGGQIVNQVHATKFPSVRAALIANEIKKVKPDVVGLQEAAWWRTGALDFSAVTSPKATQTDPEGGDFLTDLLTQLNAHAKGKSKKGKKGKSATYRVAVVKDEFDQELPVNDGAGGPPSHNERLTMRDAILVRKGVKISHPNSGTFNTLLHVTVGGSVPVNVTRGWVSADVKVHGRTTHVIDTHLEAFDSQSSNQANDGNTYPKGGIREAQAKQLVQTMPSGAVLQSKPNVLLGDLNSDFPVNGDQVFPGDALAYQAVLAGGFGERSASVPPFGCCIQDPNLADPSTAGITHRVDHVMSNKAKIKFRKGGLTSTYANGLWSSDHFGLWSQLLIK
jgi:endonuclease/exonuclease/phosphatase family metal-dependent hydrolase